MNPQERTYRRPVVEFRALKEPRGSPLGFVLACNIVICVRIWWRKLFVDVLFYLCP